MLPSLLVKYCHLKTAKYCRRIITGFITKSSP